jgi:hypothetical protein
LALAVVSRVGEVEVQISQKSTGVRDEEGTKGKDRSDEAVVDESVDSAVLDHLPCIFCSCEVRLAVEGDVAEGIAVEELDGPLQKTKQATNAAEDCVTNHAATRSLLVASSVAELAQELHDGDQQAAQTDGTKAVGQGTLGGSASGILGEVVRVEVPRAIDASNCCVDCVLEPLREPVHRKGSEGNKTDNLALAATSVGARRIVVGRLIFDVYSYQSDRVPSREGCSNDASDKTGEINMAVLLANINGGSEHESRKGDSRNPGPEAERHEQTKDQEHYSSRPVFAIQVKDGRSNCETHIENTSDPDELLGEESRKPDICEGEDKCDGEDKHEENDGTRVERKVVAIAIDSIASVALVSRVSLKNETRHGGKADHNSDQKDASPEIIVLWLCDLELLVKRNLLVAVFVPLSGHVAIAAILRGTSLILRLGRRLLILLLIRRGRLLRLVLLLVTPVGVRLLLVWSVVIVGFAHDGDDSMEFLIKLALLCNGVLRLIIVFEKKILNPYRIFGFAIGMMIGAGVREFKCRMRLIVTGSRDE